jgi:REP element-mobilizing transposase RayT
MYHNRVKEDPLHESVFYLITNRVAGGSFLFKDAECEHLKNLMIEGEGRFAYRVWDYVIMNNHYHCLIEVFSKDAVTDDQLLAYYNTRQLKPVDKIPCEYAREQLREKVHDISCIVGNFQQRFTQWFNKKHQRWGRLFGGRFDGEIVQTSAQIMKIMAYITLNPVRAGMVTDPKDYRFCAYAQRQALHSFPDDQLFDMLKEDLSIDPQFWHLQQELKRHYFADLFRAYLLGVPLEKGGSWDQQTLGDYLEKQGCKKELSWNDKFMHRCDYFTHGLVIGCEEFVRVRLEKFSKVMGWKRPHEPCTQNDWDDIYVLKRHRRTA